jgi:hypothetical protein
MRVTRYYLSTTLVFYFVTPPSVSPVVIIIMYHVVPTTESFEVLIFDLSLSVKGWEHRIILHLSLVRFSFFHGMEIRNRHLPI